MRFRMRIPKPLQEEGSGRAGGRQAVTLPAASPACEVECAPGLEWQRQPAGFEAITASSSAASRLSEES